MLRPRLYEILKSHRWRLPRPVHCSVLRCLVRIVSEVIRLVNPSCGFFPQRASAAKTEHLGRLPLRLAGIKLVLIHPPSGRAPFGLARGGLFPRLSARLATRLASRGFTRRGFARARFPAAGFSLETLNHPVGAALRCGFGFKFWFAVTRFGLTRFG